MDKKNKKGFTLVELIVVITILAILWTVSFLSFNGYAKSARNAKRIDSIWKISAAIEGRSAGGKSLLGFVISWQEVIDAKIAGTPPTVWGNYKAGIVNFRALEVRSEDYRDPSYNDFYRAWVTLTSKWRFEAAATLEQDDIKIAKVIGNWNPRLSSSIAWNGASWSKKFTLSNISNIGSLNIWDTISGTWVPTGTKIKAISNDSMNLFLDQALTASTASISLSDDEVVSLIASSGDPNIPVTDTTVNVPYASDTSVLISTLPFLQSAGGVSQDIGNSSAVDSAGNSYVAWYYDDGGDDDLFISKFDGSGALDWTTNAWWSGDDRANSIVVDNVGSTYVTWYFSGTAVFWSITLVSAGNDDIFVIKLDNSGNILWATKMGGTSADRWKWIHLDDDGRILVTGYFRWTADFWVNSLISNGNSEAFLTILDGSGSIWWSTAMWWASVDEGNYIAHDTSGDYIVTWFFSGTSTHGATTLVSSGSTDTFITKIDSSGSITWATKVGGWSSDVGNGIDIDVNDNIYITWYFWGAASQHGATVLSSNGNFDVFITKIDDSGNILWAKGVWGAWNDRGLWISIDLIGNSYTTWYFNGSFTYGAETVNSLWAEDVFVIKLDSNWDFL